MASMSSPVRGGHCYYRVPSRYDYMMASVGVVIGSGRLFGVLYSAREARPGAILSWLIGGVLMLMMAMPRVEMGGVNPEAGSLPASRR